MILADRKPELSHQPTPVRPRLGGILETALTVEDVARAASFYIDIFGFELLSQNERLCALSARPAQVLLLFKRDGSLEDLHLPGGVLPGGMDARGRSHIAFQIRAEHLDHWRRWLDRHSVQVQSTVTWDRGGTSLYFRDLDGNLLELATPGVWANY